MSNVGFNGILGSQNRKKTNEKKIALDILIIPCLVKIT